MMNVPAQIHKFAILLLVLPIVLPHFWSTREKHAPLNRIGLAEFVPEEIGPWKFEEIDDPTQPPPFAYLNEFYKGVFIDEDGRAVVLSIEYGSDFRRHYQMHLPDDCHRTRGDTVHLLPDHTIHLGNSTELPSALMEWEYPRSNVNALCAYWVVLEGEQSSDIPWLKLRQFFAGILHEPREIVLIRIDQFYGEDGPRLERSKKLESLDEFVESLYRSINAKGRLLFFGSIKPDFEERNS
ncbi:MAG: exosortase-associated EpsI family protein [Acidobacteriota bacterium]|nr:MAG: exosortase-associated EpsI family protein [Acidobacteriota bacterium]